MGFSDIVGLEVETAGGGDAVVRMTASDELLNRHGTVLGGAIATLVDMAMGAAVANADDRDTAPVTIEMKVTYLEPGQLGDLVATAHVRKRGKTLTIVEAEVTQGDDLIALALATFTS